MAVCSRRGPSGTRNRALIVLLYRTGLRIAEALALSLKDVDPDAGAVRVLRGKGGKARVVGIDPGAWPEIEGWIDARRDLDIDDVAPLFCTLRGRPMDCSYVRKTLRRLAGRAGISKRVHPHGLRHTLAAQLAAEGMPINMIQAQLGHSNAATTSRYIQHIAPQQLIVAMSQRRW